MTTGMIAVMLALHQQPVWATTMACGLAWICLWLLDRYRKPWPYTHSVSAALLAALSYAWPET